MRLVVERELGAPPAAVWPYLTEPARMNEWSTARIDGVANDGGASFSHAGARRQVRIPVPLPGFSVVLDEVIEESERPRRFVYRVVGSNVPVGSHRGEIRLEPSDLGTHLRWTVDVVLPVPLFAWVARRILTRELRRSLDTLSSLLTE